MPYPKNRKFDEKGRPDVLKMSLECLIQSRKRRSRYSGCVSKKNFCLPPGLEEEVGAHVMRLPISSRSRLAFVRKLK
jgi:hypothetical protein